MVRIGTFAPVYCGAQLCFILRKVAFLQKNCTQFGSWGDWDKEIQKVMLLLELI